MNNFNSKLLNKILLITSLGLSMAVATSAQAVGSASANLQLNTEVVANCTISAGTLDVSGYDSIVANKTADFDQKSTVTVTCTKDTDVTIGLGQGSSQRHLKSGDNSLAYELYQDASRSKVWAEEGETRLAVKGTGLEDVKDVYIRVPKGQNVPAGKYADIVTATVTF